MVKLFGVSDSSVSASGAGIVSKSMGAAFGFGSVDTMSSNGFSLGVISVAENDSSIAVAKGVFLGFCGNLFGFSKKPSVSVAHALLDLYLKEKSLGFVKALNGAFSICIYNSEKEEVHLITDRCGLRPIFYAVQGKQLLFASELKAIVEIQKNPGVNWEFWKDFFSYGYGLGSKTPFEGIKSLQNGSILTFRDGNARVKSYWDYDSIKVRKRPVKQIVNEGVNVLENVFKRACDGMDKCNVLLSGGYDSRCILASIDKFTSAKPFAYLTAKAFSHPPGHLGNLDVKYGVMVAERLNIPFKVYADHSGYYEKHFVKHVWLMEGLSYENMWLLPLTDKISDGWISFDGLAGDAFLKAGYLVKPELSADEDLFDDRVVNKLSNHELASIIHTKLRKMAFFNYDKVHKLFSGKYRKYILHDNKMVLKELMSNEKSSNTIKVFQLKNRVKNAISLSPNNILGRKSISYMPFCDNEFVEFSMSIPIGIKARINIYDKILKRAFPELAGIPTTNDSTNLKDKLTNYTKLFGLWKIARLVVKLKSKFSLEKKKFLHDKLSQNPLDAKYLIGLARKMNFPAMIDKDKLLNQINNDVGRDLDPSNYLEPILYFVIWHKLFIEKDDEFKRMIYKQKKVALEND